MNKRTKKADTDITSSNTHADASQRMFKTIEILQQAFSRIRTGRAHPSLLNQVMVNCYGSKLPLNQVASVGIQDTRTLSVVAFDKSTIHDIEKAIMSTDLGLNPVTTGEVIRIPLPPLTEDRRKELVKIVRAEAENAKVAIRNIRRNANQILKDLLKEKKIAENESRNTEGTVQKLTDDHISKVDQLLGEKEKEMMQV